jgi:hypothetical protein
MSRDLSGGKKPIGSITPEKSFDSVGLERVEGFVTPQNLRDRFLWGIPLRSKLTKQEMNDTLLLDFINRGANMAEIEAQIEITPTLKRTKQPFDRNMYEQFIYLEVPFKPIQKVISLAITSPNYTDLPQQGDQYPAGSTIYRIPPEWIETANFNRGRINVIPLQSAYNGLMPAASFPASGAAILMFLGMQSNLPAYWEIEVLVGFVSENGDCPVLVNELVGMKAAMLVLDNLIPQYSVTSQSMGIDGMSQSVGDQMYNLLTTKRQQLEKDYMSAVKRAKVLVGNTLFSSHI